MKLILAVSFMFLIVIMSCKKITTDTNNEVITQDIINFANTLNISIAYYDSINIETNESFLFNSKDVSKIEIGSKSTNQFQVFSSIEPRYVSNENSVSLFLSEGVKVDPKLTDLELTIRLHAKNNQYYDLDTLIHMYKYPYPSTEIYLTYEEIFREDPWGDLVQDFDFIDSILFVHARGPHGIISINSETLEYNVVLPIENAPPAWSYLTCTQNFIFYENTGLVLWRLNLEKDSSDLQIDLSNLTYEHIHGLDYNENILYVFMETDNLLSNHLSKFDMNGNFLGSISYPKLTFHMAIADNIVYAIASLRLSRFDISSNNFLEDVMLPSIYWDGIRIHEDYFYFADYNRQFIGRVPMSEIN